MTLADFFDAVSADPIYVIFYFIMIPLVALLTNWLARGEGDLSPWKYLYSSLLYLVCVPGIFAVSLAIYLFLFERRSVFQMNILLEILPILSMVATILIARRNVDFDYVPGFDKLSGLIMIIVAALGIMWFVDRTRIIALTYVPIQWLLLVFIGLLVVIRFGWSKMTRG
jgi:hypothetical protein